MRVRNMVINDKVVERAVETGKKFVLQYQTMEQSPTVRSISKEIKVSKSTVHKDLTERLKQCNESLYQEVNKILQENKSERHERGGEATKRKYLQRQRKILE